MQATFAIALNLAVVNLLSSMEDKHIAKKHQALNGKQIA